MKHEWRITYRRTGWQQEGRRLFQTEHWANRYVEKLRGWGRPDLAAIEFIVVEKRSVGEWEKQ